MTIAQRRIGPRRNVSGSIDWSRSVTGEPPLSELLADPCLHLILRRDRLTLADLAAVIDQAQQTLRRGLCRRAA